MKRRLLFALAAVTLLVGACGSGDDDTAAESSDTTVASEPVTVRLGYFPNITHATPLVGVAKGIYADKLGTDKLEVQTFNAGPAAIEALFAKAIDATYIGPNPAINAWAQSNGSAIKIISGATSGGAALVVKPEINSSADLKGKTLATPQLGNTQDVALKNWLKEEGLKIDAATGTGDVKVQPQENGLTLQLFQQGDIAGAWVPEPWVTRLVQEGGGKVLVDEKTLWPGGNFVTTHLIVRTEFLKENPGAVRRLLEGHVAATDFVNANTTEAQTTANDEIGRITGKKIADGVVTTAWKTLRFTNNPIAASLRTGAKHAESIGLLKPVDLTGIYDLKLLNEILSAAGKEPVKVS